MSKQHMLLDTGVLLIFVVGSVSPLLISHHKKVDAFAADDFHLLMELIDQSAGPATTPNCWTEVSNQLEYGVPSDWRGALRHRLKMQMINMRERFVASSVCASDDAFLALGVADCGLLQALDDQTMLLTIDVPLFEHASARGLRVENFHHIREARGLA